MSTNIMIINNSGSRGVDLHVTSYSGGRKQCIQLTAETEEGDMGYVQLSTRDLKLLMPIITGMIANDKP